MSSLFYRVNKIQRTGMGEVDQKGNKKTDACDYKRNTSKNFVCVCEILISSIHFLDFFTGSDSIQGTWCKDILQTIMSFTPHNWASHTLSCFPAPLQVIVSN